MTYLANVTVASITTRIRGLPTEVELDRAQGLDDVSVVNCDNLFTVSKSSISRTRGELGPAQVRMLDIALQSHSGSTESGGARVDAPA